MPAAPISPTGLEATMPITLLGRLQPTPRSSAPRRASSSSISGPTARCRSTVAQERPDFLLSDFNVYTYNIQLRDISGAEGHGRLRRRPAASTPATARPRSSSSDGAARDGRRALRGCVADGPADRQPRSTPTQPRQQLLAAGGDPHLELQRTTCSSACTARRRSPGPQFRELAPQIYQDFESDREFTGNPFLIDSELINAEARYEWYFAPRPADHASPASTRRSTIRSRRPPSSPAAASCAPASPTRRGPSSTAPRSRSRPICRSTAWAARFWATRRLLLIGNYTYTQSSVNVGRLARSSARICSRSPPTCCSRTARR